MNSSVRHQIVLCVALTIAGVAFAAPPTVMPGGRAPIEAQPQPSFASDVLSPDARWESLKAELADPIDWSQVPPEADSRSGAPLQIGVNTPLAGASRTTAEAGVWTETADGVAVWRIIIRSPGAHALRVQFSQFHASPGTRLLVAGTDGRVIEVPLAEALDGRDGLWTPMTIGGVVHIELRVEDRARDLPSASVAAVSHIYEAAWHNGAADRSRDDCPPPCAVDVNCETVDQVARDSVGLMVFTVPGQGTYVCTGSLLNDADPNTFAGWFATAHHCINSQVVAETLIVYWFYDTDACDGTAPELSSLPQSYGADLVVGTSASDFSLLRLHQDPEDGQGLAAWSADDPVSIDVAGVHHPCGAPKNIAFGTLTDDPPICGPVWTPYNFFFLDWYLGMTAGGSSGSPLYNDDWEFIGTLTGACFWEPPGCDNPEMWNNNYGRFARAFPLVAQNLTGTPLEDAFEENDDFGSAAPLDLGRYEGSATDDDYYSITLCEAGTLDVSLEYDPAVVQPALELLSDVGGVLGTSHSGTGAEQIELPLEPDAYIIHVISDPNAVGSYVLNVDMTDLPTRVYVDADNVGCANGRAWPTAFTDLQVALDYAASHMHVTEIWVAEGSYIPTASREPGYSRTATFKLVDGVALYGGFAGTETTLAERELNSHTTVLSGDLQDDDGPGFANRQDNALHVVSAYIPGTNTLLDGFTIRGGHADLPFNPDEAGAGLLLRGGALQIRQCTLEDNDAGYAGAGLAVREGGTIHVSGSTLRNNVGHTGSGVFADSSDMTLEDCLFESNQSSYNGGAVNHFGGATSSIVRSQFIGNSAVHGGAVTVESGCASSIADCDFLANSASGNGGALDSYEATVTISRCTFTNNHAEGSGGGIWVNGQSSATASDCVFENNSASWAGGGGAANSGSQVVLVDCIFDGNGGGSGGGFWATQFSEVTISDTEFLSNTCDYAGGALNIEQSSTLTMNDCVLHGNSGLYGGTLFWGWDSTGSIRRTAFIGGYAAGNGGAADINTATVLFKSCLFTGNQLTLSSNGEGSAIAFWNADATLANCTFAQCYGPWTGAVYLPSGSLTATDTVFWDNQNNSGQYESAQIDWTGGSLTIDYSCVEGWTEGLGGVGNHGLDPLFVDAQGPDNLPGTLDDDLRLTWGSPAQDAGNPAIQPGPDLLDLDRHWRVLCGRVDMGAYETGFADLNCDGLIGIDDFYVFAACMAGPEVPTTTECVASDLDTSGDCSLRDFAAFQRVFAGQ